jgi:hypothetical protein
MWRDFFMRRKMRRSVGEDNMIVVDPNKVPPGAWFLFSENGTPKLGFGSVGAPVGVKGDYCVIVSPGVPTARARKSLPSNGVFLIDGAFVASPSNVTAFRCAFDGKYDPGSLIITPDSQLLAFMFNEGDSPGGAAAANLKSGTFIEKELRPPYGWFSQWRLFQSGPKGRPEQIFQFPST